MEPQEKSMYCDTTAIAWCNRVTIESPPVLDRTPWFDGTTHPVRNGWYERIFTDGIFRHYWDGAMWLIEKDGKPHWRQVGDYPAWRGLTKKAHKWHSTVAREFARFRNETR